MSINLNLNEFEFLPILYNVPIIYPETIIESSKRAIYSIKFSFDGEHCMTTSQDFSVKLYNPFKKLLIKSYEKIHNNEILDICIFKDNSKFSSVGLEKQIFLTDTIKSSLIRKFYGHLDRVNSICTNFEETILVSGSQDCSVRIWDLKTQSKEPIQTLIDATDSISKVLCTQNNILSISLDGCLRIYDIRMGKNYKYDMKVSLNGFDISKDNNFLCLSGIDDCVRLLEIKSGKILKVFTGLHKSKNYSKVVKFSNDNKGIYVTSENNDIIYYDLIDEKKDKILRGHSNISSGFDINIRKEDIGISSGFDGKILLWNLNLNNDIFKNNENKLII